MIDFRGAYTALVTPFTAAASQVDRTRLEGQIARQAEAGVTGIVPCGTTGESPTLSESEHLAVVETAVRVGHAHGLRVIAGSGSNCTAHAVELHRHAARLGADAALHVCPYYNKPSQEGLLRHFSAVADAADLPVILYNIPGRTGVGLGIETIERLAAHPNIRAIKEASGGTGLAVQVMARTDLAVLSGDDPLTLPLMLLGGTGVISVLSNVLPRHVAELCRAAAAADVETARRLHAEVLPLAEALLTVDTNPVPVKAALALLGLDTGAVRLPLAPASEAAVQRLRELLDRVEAPGAAGAPEVVVQAGSLAPASAVNE